MNILYLFLPFSGEKSFFFLFLILIMPAACSQLTFQLMRVQEPHFTHRPSLHPFCNFFASCLFRWHCSWLTSYSQCTWRMISSYPWCCCLIVVQFSFQLFLFCPYMLLVIFYTQSIASEHGFFLLCTLCTCFSLSSTAGTFQHSQSPLATTESCSRFISSVASCCGPPTT